MRSWMSLLGTAGRWCWPNRHRRWPTGWRCWEMPCRWCWRIIRVALTSRPRASRIEGKAWRVTSPGVYGENDLRPLTAALVLFVCTGNTCRSPMAEAIFKRILADRLGCAIEELPSRGWWVASAGLGAWGANRPRRGAASREGARGRFIRSRQPPAPRRFGGRSRFRRHDDPRSFAIIEEWIPRLAG